MNHATFLRLAQEANFSRFHQRQLAGRLKTFANLVEDEALYSTGEVLKCAAFRDGAQLATELRAALQAMLECCYDEELNDETILAVRNARHVLAKTQLLSPQTASD